MSFLEASLGRKSWAVWDRWAVKSSTSDVLTFSLLAGIVAVLSVQLPFKAALWGPWAFHAALLAFFGGSLLFVLPRWARERLQAGRAVATVAVMHILYRTVGHVAHDAMPWSAEGLLETWEKSLLGGHAPHQWLGAVLTAGWVEFFSFFYIFFLPYLYTTLVLGCLGRRPMAERRRFLTGFAWVYAVSLALHFLLPARGPVALPGAASLPGGTLHEVVLLLVRSAGGPHGAFPSLHVAASAYSCFFELRHAPRRGRLYWPVVVLISLSAVFLGYHYVVDVLAGFFIAAAAVWGSGVLAERELVLEGRPLP